MNIFYWAIALAIFLGFVVFAPRYIGTIHDEPFRQGWHDLTTGTFNSAQAKPIIAAIAWIFWVVFGVGLFIDLLRVLKRHVAKIPFLTKTITHIVLPGETIATIAMKYYGPEKMGRMWLKIVDANLNQLTPTGKLLDVFNLQPGDALIIPEVSRFRAVKHTAQPFISYQSPLTRSEKATGPDPIIDMKGYTTIDDVLTSLEDLTSTITEEGDFLEKSLASARKPELRGIDVKALPPVEMTVKIETDLEKLLSLASPQARSMVEHALQVLREDRGLLEWLYGAIKFAEKNTSIPDWKQAAVDRTAVYLELSASVSDRFLADYVLSDKMLIPRSTQAARLLSSVNGIPRLPLPFDFKPNEGRFYFRPMPDSAIINLRADRVVALLMLLETILRSPWRASTLTISTIPEVQLNLNLPKGTDAKLLAESCELARRLKKRHVFVVTDFEIPLPATDLLVAEVVLRR